MLDDDEWMDRPIEPQFKKRAYTHPHTPWMKSTDRPMEAAQPTPTAPTPPHPSIINQSPPNPDHPNLFFIYHQTVSPYHDLEKATVLQECRVFHDANIVTQDPRRCCQLITKLLHILTQVRSWADFTIIFYVACGLICGWVGGCCQRTSPSSCTFSRSCVCGC